MKRGWDLLPPSATCELEPSVLCGWRKETKSYNEAILEGSKHYKETGHAVRIEQIRTFVIEYNDEYELIA